MIVNWEVSEKYVVNRELQFTDVDEGELLDSCDTEKEGIEFIEKMIDENLYFKISR